jgi:hypothetical protein
MATAFARARRLRRNAAFGRITTTRRGDAMFEFNAISAADLSAKKRRIVASSPRRAQREAQP